MGKIVSNFFISLDGVVEAPDQWHFEWFDDEMGGIIGDGFATTAAMLMGRRLYDDWSVYWPEHADDDVGKVINGLPKYVVSDSLSEATWQNTTLVPGNGAAERLRQVKAETDGDITVSGSATTVRWLLREGLLDELRLLIHPVAVGKGQRLFEDQAELTKLRLVDQRTLGSGVLYVAYAPA
jgi:dihydrofolate reductase